MEGARSARARLANAWRLYRIVLEHSNSNGKFEYYVDSTITETHLVDGGVPELATRMAAKIGDALRFSSPVRRIKQSAIVATPPYLASRIDYDPMLPPMQGQSLRRLLSGAAIRGITIYDSSHALRPDSRALIVGRICKSEIDSP